MAATAVGVAEGSIDPHGTAERVAGAAMGNGGDPLAFVAARRAVSDDELCDAALGAQRVLDLALVDEARLLVELDRRGVTDTVEGHRTAKWTGWWSNRPTGLVSSHLRVAKVLVEHLPDVLDAVVAGAISFEHARVLAHKANPRIRGDVAAMAAELVELAKGRTFCSWRDFVSDVAALLDDDGAFDPNDVNPKMSATASRDLDGDLRLTATITGAGGLTAYEAIQTETRRLLRRCQRDAAHCPDLTIPSMGQLRAQALCELLTRGAAVYLATDHNTDHDTDHADYDEYDGCDDAGSADHGPGASHCDDADGGPDGGRSHPDDPPDDATADTAGRTTGADDTTGTDDTTAAASAGGPDDTGGTDDTTAAASAGGTGCAPGGRAGTTSRPGGCDTSAVGSAATSPDAGWRLPPSFKLRPTAEAVVVINADDPTHPGTTRDGHPIDPITAAVLCCDPNLHPLHCHNDRQPLHLGRAVRYATPHQRRAAAIRDGGCCFPGCDTPLLWCDLHHIEHWHHGGPTDLPNLIHLCRHHHTITHRRHWHLHTTTHPTTGHTHHHWTTPTGATLWAQRHHTPHPPPPPPPPHSDRTSEHTGSRADTSAGTGADPP